MSGRPRGPGTTSAWGLADTPSCTPERAAGAPLTDMHPRHQPFISSLALCATLACSEATRTPASAAAGSGGRVADAGAAGRTADAGSGGRVADAGSGGRTADAGIIPDPGGDPDFSVPAGTIRVTTWLDLGETELTASFADVPAVRFHHEAGRVGQCRLMDYEPSTCTPACAGGDACIDQRCEAYPTRIDRGPIDWEWPGGRQTVSASSGTLGYHGTGAASEAGDVNVRVDGITLDAPSDDAPAPDTDWTAALAARGAGSDVTLRWSNPSPGARIRVHMTDCVGSHGGFAAAELECESADSGALVLPGAFLDRLDAGDWSHGECGAHRFERYRTAAPDGDDSFRLETIAPAAFFHRPGLSP